MTSNETDNIKEVLKINEMKLTNGSDTGKRKDYLGKKLKRKKKFY